MAIVIGDIHGNVEKVQAFLNYKPEVEHIALGDYLDSFFETPARQIQALNLLLASNAVLLWGNHDLHYLEKPPWYCSGRQWHTDAEKELVCLIESNKSRFKVAYEADGWLCTHAGVQVGIAQETVTGTVDFINAEFGKWLMNPKCFQRHNGDITTQPDSIFSIGRRRGGSSNVGGIFWFDHLRESGLAPMRQLFGHTEGQKPERRQNFVCLDTTNTVGDAWVWDTVQNELVQLPTSRHYYRIRDLPEEQRAGFRKYLYGQTAPLIADESDEDQDGYFCEDYLRWLAENR